MSRRTLFILVAIADALCWFSLSFFALHYFEVL